MSGTRQSSKQRLRSSTTTNLPCDCAASCESVGEVPCFLAPVIARLRTLWGNVAARGMTLFFVRTSVWQPQASPPRGSAGRIEAQDHESCRTNVRTAATARVAERRTFQSRVRRAKSRLCKRRHDRLHSRFLLDLGVLAPQRRSGPPTGASPTFFFNAWDGFANASCGLGDSHVVAA